MNELNSDKLLRATLNSIDDGVILTGTDSRVAFLNPVAERLTGWSQAVKLRASRWIRYSGSSTRRRANLWKIRPTACCAWTSPWRCRRIPH